MSYTLSVVIPTLNEVGNIEPLYQRLSETLQGIDWEVIFVDDDSNDGTLDKLRNLSARQINVHCLQRIGRRGLASAAIEGMLAASAPYIAVMDADMQHDESLLRDMLDTLLNGAVEIVVASRFLAGASTQGLNATRERLSRLGNSLSRAMTKTNLTDPLAGFFMLRREIIQEVAHSLTAQGYKILLDIVTSTKRPLSVVEIPMRFRHRHAGASKLDLLVMLEFAMLLADKLFGRFVPVRFVLFTFVGMLGAALHVAILWLAFKVVGTTFYSAQALATLVAMTSNFYLNNEFTHRDRKLAGLKFLTGLMSFYLVCSIGAIANLQLAEFLYKNGIIWILAGLIGAIVGSVWNYGVSSTFTWRRRSRT
jgi:dolichol-phosphate mannosyltransferase